MRYKLSNGLTCLALALAGIAGEASAQTTAAGPYYASPSWDQTMACTTAANCPRFVVLSNMNSQAVLDRETGLVWLRNAYDIDSDRSSPWALAKENCEMAHWGTGRLGWRLPLIEELTSLLTVAPSPLLTAGLPAGHPFAVPSIVNPLYWSATEATYPTADGSRAKVLNLSNGGVGSLSKTQSVQYWCVRGSR